MVCLVSAFGLALRINVPYKAGLGPGVSVAVAPRTVCAFMFGFGCKFYINFGPMAECYVRFRFITTLRAENRSYPKCPTDLRLVYTYKGFEGNVKQVYYSMHFRKSSVVTYSICK